MFKKILTFSILTIFLVSCGSQKKVYSKKKTSKPKVEVVVKKDKTSKTNEQEDVVIKPTTKKISSTTEYIETFKDIAIEEMKKYGIPASITLAQGILESGSGKGRLSREANNHFGIKCHDWKGAKIYHDDDEKQECFRKYVDAKYSFSDHSTFLTSRKRYSKLFDLGKTDYKAWAKGLREAGYATDRKYPQKLISLIERYKLYKYDGKASYKANTAKKSPTISDNKESASNNHIVKAGDTLYSISKRYNITVNKLKSLNSLRDNAIKIDQVLKIK